MYMLEIIALENGAHRNQSYNGVLLEGWAIIPNEMGELKNFPFGEVVVEDVPHYRDVSVVREVTHTKEQQVVDAEGKLVFDENGNPVMETVEYTTEETVIEQEEYFVPTVTKWIPGIMPEPEPEPEKEPTTEEILNAMLGVQ